MKAQKRWTSPKASRPRQVQLFVPCYVDQFFPGVARATLRVLQHVGCEVQFPEGQTCCGQPAFNAGYWKEAGKVAETWLRAFRGDLPVVTPSGSCVSMVSHFYGYLPLSRKDRCRWEGLKQRTYELSRFLVGVCGLKRWEGRLPLRLAYHDACHALRELEVAREPRMLLAGINGLELMELAEPEVCCGFGGTFSVKFPDLSTALAQRKVQALMATGAQAITSTDMSCLAHIGGYLQKQGRPVQVLHLAQVLAAALEENEPSVAPKSEANAGP